MRRKLLGALVLALSAFLLSAQTTYKPRDLNDLRDVNAGSPSDNDALTWDAGTSKWIPEAVSSTTYTGTSAYFLTPQMYGDPVTVVNTSLGTANQVVAYRMYIPMSITIDRIAFQVGVAGSAGAKCSVGLYNSDGTTKALDTGAIACDSTGTKDTDVTNATVGPGYYWVAYTSTDTGVNVWASNQGATNWATSVWNATVVHRGTAANASSGGVLPATLGAVTNANYGYILTKFQG